MQNAGFFSPIFSHTERTGSRTLYDPVGLWTLPTVYVGCTAEPRRLSVIYLLSNIFLKEPCYSNLLTPWNNVLLQKLTGFQLVKKFPAFYGTRSFIASFPSARHLSLSWTRLIQSMVPRFPSWRSLLILSSHLLLDIPGGLFPSGYPTKVLYTLLAPIRTTCPAYLIIIDMLTRTPENIGWRVQIIKLFMM